MNEPKAATLMGLPEDPPARLPVRVAEVSVPLLDTIAAGASVDATRPTLKEKSLNSEPQQIPDSVSHLTPWIETTAPFDWTCSGFHTWGIFPCSGNNRERSEFSQRCSRDSRISSGYHFPPVGLCWRTTSPGVSSPDRSSRSRTFWPRPWISTSPLMRTGSKKLLLIPALLSNYSC